MLVLFLITALRYPVLGGTDNLQYAITFNSVPKLDGLLSYDESEFTIGYLFFNSLSKTIFENYIFFQIFYTFSAILLLSIVLKKLELSNRQKCFILFGYFCYKFLWFFWGTLRQNLADLFFWLILLYIYKKKDGISNMRLLILGGLSVIIPTLFHSSGIINVIFVPFLLSLHKLADIKKRLRLVLIISVSLFLLSGPIFDRLLSYIILIDPRYMMYEDYAAGGANFINYLFRLFFFVIFCLNYHRINYKYKNFVLDTLTMCIIIGSINQPLMGRVLEYYAIGLYLSMGFFPMCCTKKNVGVFKFVYCIAMLIIFVRFLTISDDGLNTHYYLFWQTPYIDMVGHDKYLFGL